MSKKTIIRLILAIFLIRLATSLLPSFMVDMSAWLAWAHRLAELGFAGFYSDDVWTQYTPGYLYYLWVVGLVGWVDPLSIKIPVILADLATASLIWLIVARRSKTVANWLFPLYVLSPVVIFDGSIWGQIDGILTLAMLSSAYYLVEKKNHLAAYALFATALLIKPQAIAIAPVMVVLTLVQLGWRQLVAGVSLAGLVILIGFYPFFPSNPILGPIELIQKMGVSYPYTSLFAYNIWSYVGMWQADSQVLLGISYFGWGTILLSVALVTILLVFRRQLRTPRVSYLLLSLSCLIFFLFPTRVHERYLFPFFAFVMAYYGLAKHKYVAVMIIIISVLYTLNLYVPYSHYESATNALKNPAFEGLINSGYAIIATIYLLVLLGLVVGERYFQVGKKEKSLSQ